jgi:hypothetical protein
MAATTPRIVEILREAWDDLLEGVEFYDDQAAGLGVRFMDEMQEELRMLTGIAGVHGVHWGCHRALPEVWPWAIYYLLEDDKIVVTAVCDCRRDPEANRLKVRARKP